ncbi:MAG: ion transporter [Paracoccaceae bacterium]|nr:ion transporter [Paracoccaceae bacterium]
MIQKLKTFINAPLTERFIIALIVINAITLGLETSEWTMARYGGLLVWIDSIILAVFVAELAIRLITDFKGFWRDPWRIFDFVVIAIALLPATGPLAVLRAFRILRVLRLVTKLESMRRVIMGLLRALPGMGTIVMLLLLIFYIFAVISTKLFADAFPEWFSTIGASAYTLFQIMTLESWSMGIVRPVMEVFPYAWLLFLPFIITTAFAVLNLFIGVIVDAMQTEHEAEARGERDAMREDTKAILSEIKALREEVATLKSTKG